MKKNLNILACLLMAGIFFPGCSKPAPGPGKTDRLYYKTGELRSESIPRGNGFFTNRIYYKNGKPHTEYEAQRYVDMVNEQWLERGHGTFRRFYDNGQVYAEGRMADDRHEGPFNAYYRDGHPRADLNYVKNKFEGLNKWYFPDGTVAVEAFYRNDKKSGPSRFYYESGTLGLEMEFRDDREHGPTKVYDPGGKEIFRLLFQDGRLEAGERYEAASDAWVRPATDPEREAFVRDAGDMIMGFFERYDRIQEASETPPDYLTENG